MTTAREIATFLGLPLAGRDFAVSRPASLAGCGDGDFVFAARFDPVFVDRLSRHETLLALVLPEYAGKLRCSHLVAANPRLEYIRALVRFFAQRPAGGIARTAVIGKDCTLGDGVSIGEYSVIGNSVTIGAGTEIRNHVVIADGVRIGAHCLVKSHVVIGEEGFGFERDDKAGGPVRFPHLGGVKIGDHVELGSFNTVNRGALDGTEIADFVKTDEHVHIAHNVFVGEGALLTACVELSGSVRIGSNAFLGPSCSVARSVVVGDNAFVGIGAVVTKDVPAGESVAGNPARRLRGGES